MRKRVAPSLQEVRNLLSAQRIKTKARKFVGLLPSIFKVSFIFQKIMKKIIYESACLFPTKNRICMFVLFLFGQSKLVLAFVKV